MKVEVAAAILGVSCDDPVDVLKEAYRKKVIAFDSTTVSIIYIYSYLYLEFCFVISISKLYFIKTELYMCITTLLYRHLIV